jgi:hypothetical protein
MVSCEAGSEEPARNRRSYGWRSQRCRPATHAGNDREPLRVGGSGRCADRTAAPGVRPGSCRRCPSRADAARASSGSRLADDAVRQRRRRSRRRVDGPRHESALEAALATDAGYIGLVASANRTAALTADLRERGVDEEALARIRSPAGLNLGPSAQEEIAVAILAELVTWRPTRGPSPADLIEEAVDPICGMTVAVAAAEEAATRDGVLF